MVNIGRQGKTSIDVHQACVATHRLMTGTRVLLLLRSRLYSHPLQRRRQLPGGALHLVPLLQPGQADAQGHEISAFVALQRHAGGGPQPLIEEFLA